MKKRAIELPKDKETDKKKGTRWLRNTIKWAGICLLGVILLFTVVCRGCALINRSNARIRTENGIQEQLYVEAGGIRQFVSIRGEDTGNPVLLFIHGGPASPISFTGYAWQTALEDRFTIVHWDQRGCGRTYYENPGAPLPTTRLLLSDMDAIIDFLCEKMGQTRIVIMGHSWGTILGMKYIQLHPDKVSAYIGVGQSINLPQGDLYAASYAIERARLAGEDTDAALLEKYMDSYSESISGDLAQQFESMSNLRQLSGKYLPNDGVKGLTGQIWMGLSSPDITMRDLRWFLAASSMSQTFMQVNQTLFEECLKFNIYDDAPLKHDMPMYFISGRNDFTTPLALVEEFYSGIEAPLKELIIIDNAGHAPFIDDPEAFCSALGVIPAILDLHDR